MGTQVRRVSVTTFAVGVLLAAACGSSPQTPSAGPTTPVTTTSTAPPSSYSGTPTATYSATTGTTSTTGTCRC